MGQIQLLSKLLESYNLTGTEARRCSWLARLPSLDLSSALVTTAVDAVCMTRVGTMVRNPRLCREGQRSYSMVIGVLVREMSALPRSKSQLSRDKIILTILLVDLCDESIMSKSNDHDALDCSMHYVGAARYADAHGLPAFDLTNSYTRFLLTKVSKTSLLIGLSQRIPIAMSSLPNRTSTENTSVSTRPTLRGWYPLARILPGLLHRVDRLLSFRSEEDCRLAQVVEELEVLKSRLRDSLDVECLTRMAIDSAPDCTGDMSEVHQCITSSTNMAISEFYHFHGWRHASRCNFAWLSCLMIDCTLLRILHSKPYTRLFPSFRTTIRQIEHDAIGMARKMCKSVYFLSSLHSLAHAHFTRTVLEVIRTFFEEIGSTDEQLWCCDVLRATNTRINRLENEGHKTMCRVSSRTTMRRSFQ